VIFLNNPQYTVVCFSQRWFSPCVPLRSCCFTMIRACLHNFRNCHLDTPYVAIFITDALAKHIPTNHLSTFKIRQVVHFPIISHGLSLSTITNALTRVLQSVNELKNIQCYQLKFLQCSQHKQILFLYILVFPLFCPPPVCAIKV
jgi:hypothetical protein